MRHILQMFAVAALSFFVVLSPAYADEPPAASTLPLYGVSLTADAAGEPDYAALGGTVERRWKSRAFVRLPETALESLADDPRVKFIQRVYTGQPLPAIPPVPNKAHTREIRAEWTAPTWFSGNYAYDGAGNIMSMDRRNVSGTDGQIDRYAYDLAGRLVYATVNGPSNSENYAYDSFGNLVKTFSTDHAATITPASLTSNRLAGATYDAAGNLTTPYGPSEKYVYDSFNMMRAKFQPSAAGGIEFYLYTADDERISSDSLDTTRWTIRDLSGKVLREWSGWVADAWWWEQDYIYRDGQMVAAERQSEEGSRRHFHSDHLGTPRLITDANGRRSATHDYFPFGAELTDFRQEVIDRGLPRPEPMKFTGHERDFSAGTVVENLDYLDYMHARYYDPVRGRFLTVDPAMDLEKIMREPQSWNRYTYVGNNPMSYTDPDGRERLPCSSFPQTGKCPPVPWRGFRAELDQQLFVASMLGMPMGEEWIAARAGRLFSGVGARIDAAIGGRLLELGVNRVGKWFEGMVAKGLGLEVKAFDKTVVDAAGKRIGQIDIETSKHIIEVTTDSTGKSKQAAKLVNNAAFNPEGKQVIIYGPNITKAAQRDIEKTGARVIRDYDELVRVINQQ